MTGTEIKAWREARGLTQAQLAELIGVHRVTLARWETGTRIPHPMVGIVLARLDQQMDAGARAGVE